MTDPATSFEAYGAPLLGLAYRMLGSMAEAEDAVQEAYLRWHAADSATVADPQAFLMTTTARICLDALRSARMRREQYVGPWLPEPVLDTAVLAPDTHTELAEDLSIELLLTLDRLSPLERAAFLLHDVGDRQPARALNEALAEITARYGMRTADLVAMQLEYPRRSRSAAIQHAATH
jgi:RNA polymerase sigma-70 factor, ECF subfamily